MPNLEKQDQKKEMKDICDSIDRGAKKLEKERAEAEEMLASGVDGLFYIVIILLLVALVANKFFGVQIL